MKDLVFDRRALELLASALHVGFDGMVDDVPPGTERPIGQLIELLDTIAAVGGSARITVVQIADRDAGKLADGRYGGDIARRMDDVFRLNERD